VFVCFIIPDSAGFEKGEKKKIQFRQYEYFCDETCIFCFERGKDRNKKIKEIAFSGGEGSKS